MLSAVKSTLRATISGWLMLATLSCFGGKIFVVQAGRIVALHRRMITSEQEMSLL